MTPPTATVGTVTTMARTVVSAALCALVALACSMWLSAHDTGMPDDANVDHAELLAENVPHDEVAR